MAEDSAHYRNISSRPEEFWLERGTRLKGCALALYYYLIIRSSWDGKERHYYLKQNDVKKVVAARELGYSRQAITAAFQTLEKFGFISSWTNFRKEAYYKIPYPLSAQGVRKDVLDYLLTHFSEEPEVITFMGLVGAEHRNGAPPKSLTGLAILMGLDGNQQRNLNKIAKYIGVLKFYNFLDYKLETLEKGGIKYNVICFTKVAVNGVPSSVPLDDKRTLEQVYEQELNEEGAAFFTKM